MPVAPPRPVVGDVRGVVVAELVELVAPAGAPLLVVLVPGTLEGDEVLGALAPGPPAPAAPVGGMGVELEAGVVVVPPAEAEAPYYDQREVPAQAA